MRVGLGYDLHRLEKADGADGGLWLGGVRVGGPWRALAHSDGDVVLHALTDAVLGAISAGDIGDLFPDTAEENRGRASSEFLAEALRRMAADGFGLVNIDVNIFLQTPKLGPFKAAIRDRLEELAGLAARRVSVKAKTGEGLDAVGRSEAVAAQAVVLLARTGG